MRHWVGKSGSTKEREEERVARWAAKWGTEPSGSTGRACCRRGTSGRAARRTRRGGQAGFTQQSDTKARARRGASLGLALPEVTWKESEAGLGNEEMGTSSRKFPCKTGVKENRVYCSYGDTWHPGRGVTYDIFPYVSRVQTSTQDLRQHSRMF